MNRYLKGIIALSVQACAVMIVGRMEIMASQLNVGVMNDQSLAFANTEANAESALDINNDFVLNQGKTFIYKNGKVYSYLEEYNRQRAIESMTGLPYEEIVNKEEDLRSNASALAKEGAEQIADLQDVNQETVIEGVDSVIFETPVDSGIDNIDNSRLENDVEKQDEMSLANVIDEAMQEVIKDSNEAIEDAKMLEVLIEFEQHNTNPSLSIDVQTDELFEGDDTESVLYEISDEDNVEEMDSYFDENIESVQVQESSKDNEANSICIEYQDDVTIYPELMELYRLVESEAGIENLACKEMVTGVVLNRVESERFPNTIHGVIHAPGAFSVVKSNAINRVSVSEETIKAVNNVYFSIKDVQDDVYFFRNRHYFSWGKPVMSIGNTYFSTYK